MKRFFRNAAVRGFAALMSMLAAGSLLSLALRGKTSPITSAVGLITSPLQGICASIAYAAQDFAAYFRSSHALQERLAQRDAEIARLRGKLADYDEARQKLALYEEFLELKKENPTFQFCEAGIIGVDAAGPFTFTLDRGSVSGIQVNNPVLIGQYLVGVVSKTTLTSCTVETILNPNVYVAVYETASGEIATANCTARQAEQGLCAVPQLRRSTAINSGCLICTSGQGGIYPKGLIVGTVLEVADDSVTCTAILQPAADFSSLRDVMILVER